MLDVKVLQYESCQGDVSQRPVIQKWGINSCLKEDMGLEAALLPYFLSGYRISHLSQTTNGTIIVLVKE